MTKTAIRTAARAVALLALALGLAGAANAHEGHEHEARGTVKDLSAERLVLTATDGKEVEFVLAPETKFLRGEVSVPRAEVEIGERAIVKYHEMGEMKHAAEVKLATRKP
jgi:hypothetical protein